MHAVIIDDLEAYLSGSLPATALDRFEAHLEACGACRGEVGEIRDASGWLAELKPAGAMEPPAGFTARVMQQAAERPALTFWSPFGDFAFGRRVIFASLLTLAVLGTVLVSREESYAPEPPTPEAAMASDTGSPNAGQMLVTLASYEP
ncbi:MAG TPA: zf-HC2 domain-containing protein [Bryobacteraceae bacterium]|nr:zf-HC2 domain-containing protein [Bryobacteraceae bacterium]